MTNPLLELKALGQSVWLDDIDRGQLRSGLFGRLLTRMVSPAQLAIPPFLNTRLRTIPPTTSRCSSCSRRAKAPRRSTKRWR